jgi:hypothetical protein
MAFFIFFIEGLLGFLFFGCGLIAAVPTIPIVFLAASAILRRY